jgi:hypothetical protein
VALTLEQLSDLVETLQKKVVTLEIEVKQYRQDILELEQQLSQSITTQKLVVQNDAQIAGRNVLADGQKLDNHDQSLSTHEQRLSTHDQSLNNHEQRLSNHDQSLGNHDQSLNNHEQRLSTHDQSLSNHEQRLNSLQQGKLSGLDVAEQSSATIGAADFLFGHSDRRGRLGRGSLGRALVDAGGSLGINWDSDWGETLINSKLRVNGDIEYSSTMRTSGRMCITGGELLYLLNKDGVIIGKEWGGNGNLVVQGDLVVKGNISYEGEMSDTNPSGSSGNREPEP